MLVIFSSLQTQAKKLIYPIEVVAGSADLIVIGEIDTIKNNSYTFKIKETLKGQTYKLISVNMFNEWTCDVRFDKPKKGQKLCLFLIREQSGWEIINGSTGELLISEDSITLGGYEEYKHSDSKFTPYRLSLTEFKNGIKAFCKLYVFTGKYGFIDTTAHFKQIGNNQQANSFKTINTFAAWLYKKMEHYKISKQ